MKLLYLDTETTGLDPAKNAVVQIAGIIEIDGEVKEEFNLKPKPFYGQLLDPEALKINGITKDGLEELEPPEAIYEQIKGILDKYVDKYDRSDKLYLVGQNIKFDHSFLLAFFKNNNDYYLGSYLHYHQIDLIAVTTIFRLAGKIELENLKLETVMEALGLPKQTHDALDDIKATRRIFSTYLAALDLISPLGPSQSFGESPSTYSI